VSDPGAGRVTTRPYVTAAVLALALAVIWGVSSVSGGGGDPASRPTAVSPPPTDRIRAPSFEGRLVFSARAPDGRPGLRQRLFVYDLAAGTLIAGPLIPTARQLAVLADGSILVVSDGTGGLSDVSVGPSLDPGAAVRHLASGSIVSVSSDGRQVSIFGSLGAGCGASPSYLRRDFRFVIGSPDPLERRARGCGVPVSAAAEDGSVAVSLVDDRGRVTTTVDDARVRALDGAAILSVGPGQTALLVELDAPVDPSAPPTGPLLVWPFAGDPRPAVERLVATRVLAWSPSGGRAIVNGVLDGSRAMWLIDPAAGTAQEILPSGGIDLGATFSGATFDGNGNAFGASAAAIVAVTSAGTYPIDLPTDAPVPTGPIVWLP
jgi:hypothetical protein